MSENKLGTYIQKLMTTVLDVEQEEFVTNLAFNESKRLNVDISDFIRKHTKDDSDEVDETEQKLLLEEDLHLQLAI